LIKARPRKTTTYWNTCIRGWIIAGGPLRLTNKPATGHYRIAIDQTLDKAYAIARADVPHFMLNNIFNPTTFRATVEITS
jgi:hypothetical protein